MTWSKIKLIKLKFREGLGRNHSNFLKGLDFEMGIDVFIQGRAGESFLEENIKFIKILNIFAKCLKSPGNQIRVQP